MKVSRLILCLAALLLAACAAPAAKLSQPVEKPANPATRAAARELYDGKPPTIYGTQFPITSYKEGLERGDAAWRNNDLDLALYMFIQALSFDGPAAEVFGKIGSIHASRRNLQLAQKAFELARQIAPDDVRILERLGLLHVELRSFAAAEPILREVIAKTQTRWRAYDALGLVLQQRGDLTDAIEQYRLALQVDSAAGPVYYHRGMAQLERGRIDLAEADFRQALTFGDTRGGADEALGRLLASQRKYPDGLAFLLANSSVATAYNTLGEVALSNKDYAAAVRFFLRAMDESSSFDERANRNLALAREYLAEQQKPKP